MIERVSLKITVIYFVVGASWILLSDKILSFLVKEKEMITFFSMIKGWAYVAITGILIYLLIHSSMERIKNAESELVHSFQSLSKVNIDLELANKQLTISKSELEQQYEQTLRNQQQLQESEKALKAYEQKLHYLAYHDQLTGLENRLALNEKLITLINRKRDQKFALLLVDIDNFKYVNDTMGHSFGDLLLVKLSERLINQQKSNSTLYRIGGDEFIVLVDQFNKREEIEKISVKILKAFKLHVELEACRIFTTVSIGVSTFPEHGMNMDSLLKNADIAVYKAKETGRNRIVFFNEPMNKVITERMYIEKYLRSALENNEFELYYQPQLEISSSRISGFEALIRWRNSELGFVSPEKFIGVAEDTHLIIPIGEWVLRTACIFLKRLHQLGYTDLNISINISMLQLLQDDFVDMVTETIELIQINAKYIELEITESILMESYEIIAAKLKLLRARGVKIALDDFGKGYSSLNYLKQLPITTLKIDKSFIDTISNNTKNKSLTDLIVKMGRSMDLCVVAEGVEKQEQVDYLVKHKCNKLQGYFFSKPIPEAEAMIIIKDQYLIK